MAVDRTSKRRRLCGKQSPATLTVSARTALSDETIATAQASRDQNVAELKQMISDESGRNPDEVALVYESNRLSDECVLQNLGMRGAAEVNVVAVPRPITTTPALYLFRNRHGERLPGARRFPYSRQNRYLRVPTNRCKERKLYSPYRGPPQL